MTGRVCIIGGGYSGTAAAIHLARHATAPLQITVLEPRISLGGGAAYGVNDPALRLNVEDSLMVVHTDALDSFPKWLDSSGTRTADPEGFTDDGEFFARRADFGRYMAAEFADTAARNKSGSHLTHCRDRAETIMPGTHLTTVRLASGGAVAADLVILAVGNERPAPPRFLSNDLCRHPAYVADAWTDGALDSVAPDSRVLLVGSGLTAVDVVVSLNRRGHRGRIDAISRRGLLPLVQGEFPGIAELLRRNSQPVPALIQKHGEPDSVRQVLAWVRADAREGAQRGASWREAFDSLRDAAKYIWPRLSLAERRRFFRHLKPYYDCHRFRLAPQVDRVLKDGFSDGSFNLRAARVTSAVAVDDRLRIGIRDRGSTGVRQQDYDHVFNCTGPNPDPTHSEIRLLQDAISSGLIAADRSGAGLAVNERCETLTRTGVPNPGILALGPMTRGHFGEVVAVAQITIQLVPLVQRLAVEGLI